MMAKNGNIVSRGPGSLGLVWLLFILGIGGNAFAQKQDAKMPWFFIQITDPQLGMFDNNASFEKETILYEAAVKKINQLNPDFVVITGDFVHNPNSDLQIQEFKRITAKINSAIPVYLTPGNHDLGQTPDKNSLERYKKNYGKDRFSFNHKGSSFIGFNTSFIKAKMAEPEEEQYNWLSKKLKKGQKADHLILFCHYPFFNKSADEPTTYSNIDVGYREKYLTLFTKNKVDALFSGHLHNNKVLKIGETQYVTTSAIGKPLGEALSGIRIIKVYSNRIEHVYYGLDAVPDTIQL
jgi:3',5'-cyclic AMP phosphodiesterase CpdA